MGDYRTFFIDGFGNLHLDHVKVGNLVVEPYGAFTKGLWERDNMLVDLWAHAYNSLILRPSLIPLSVHARRTADDPQGRVSVVALFDMFKEFGRRKRWKWRDEPPEILVRAFHVLADWLRNEGREVRVKTPTTSWRWGVDVPVRSGPEAWDVADRMGAFIEGSVLRSIVAEEGVG